MKIVLITAQFPNYDDPGVTYATPFLFNYAKEWVKEGNEVTVIHLMRVYPAVFNGIARFGGMFGLHSLEKYIISPTAQNEKSYVYENVYVHRFTYKKYIPHGDTPSWEIRNLAAKIKNVIEEFSPDLILGDFFDPVIAIIGKLKNTFNCPVGQTIHITDFPMFESRNIKSNLKKIDFWLLRSKPQILTLKKYVKNPQTFCMYSGIENNYIEAIPSFRKTIHKLLYVGTLHKFKGIDTLLEALAIMDTENVSLNIVGTGSDEIYFKMRVKELKLDKIVTFVGKVSHEEVFKYMRESDLQIMISHETFGMVYVEAMSQGCIPIGAYGEGIDGVVVNGNNGFLSPLNDSKALASLLNKIIKMPSEEICSISKHAYNTSCQMTHNKLAKDLLNQIKDYGCLV